MTEETDEERRAAICCKQGFRIEDITTWENEGAPLPYRWGACVGDFESGERQSVPARRFRNRNRRPDRRTGKRRPNQTMGGRKQKSTPAWFTRRGTARRRPI